MKKTITLLTVMLLCITFTSAFAQENDESIKTEQYIAASERNIKLLSNALELYSNDHFREYPDEKEFYSKSFYPYISKAFGRELSDPGQFYLCPPNGKIVYEKSAKTLAYKLSCPHPEKYNLKKMYFSTEDGYVSLGENEEIPATAENTQAAEEEWVEASPELKEEMVSIINDLYQAYKDRDLEKVMEIEEEAILRSARKMEEEGKYTAVEVYYAFKGTANDLFRAEGFSMEPLNLEGVRFRKKGELYQAYSVVPIISTSRVTVGTMKVRLRIGSLDFERIDGKLRIVKMQMY